MSEMNSTEPCVKILGINSLGTEICAAASRISTTNGTSLAIYQKSHNNPNNQKLISAVLSSGHQSIMEHCFFNIAFNNVSAFVEQYLIEFRLSSFTVQSRRYVDFSKIGFYASDSLPKDMILEYNQHMKMLINSYEKLLECGIPKEDARFVLPYCFHSNFYCSCNARELLHIICSMIYGRGSLFEELQNIGRQLAREFEEYFPAEIKKHEKKYQCEKERTNDWYASLHKKSVSSAETCTTSVQVISHSTLTENDVFHFSDYNFAFACEHENDQIDSILLSSRSRELELISMCFLIKNISLSSITHLVRHRMQSVLIPCVGNAVYQNRYVLPTSIKSDAQALDIYSTVFLSNALFYKKMLAMGMSPINSVYFALSGNTLDVVSSMNGRELVHFVKLRTCNRAQWEIRKTAEDMLRIARSLYPMIFTKVGPSCYMTGFCPEGSKTCGKISDVKYRFKNI